MKEPAHHLAVFLADLARLVEGRPATATPRPIAPASQG
jgi:hypothetical protein